MERLTCPCCLVPGSLETRFDKHSRPYAVCTQCSIRIFLRGAQSLVGLTHASPVLAELAERAETDQSEWKRMQETKRRVNAALSDNSPASKAERAEHAEHVEPIAAGSTR